MAGAIDDLALFPVGLGRCWLSSATCSAARAPPPARTAEPLHSLPTYHGAFVASACWCRCSLIFASAFRSLTRIVESQALDAFDPAIARSTTCSAAPLCATSMHRWPPASFPASRPIGAAARRRAYASLHSLVEQLPARRPARLRPARARLRSAHAYPRTFRARNHVERFVKVVLLACAGVAVLTTIGIVFSVLFETLRFFRRCRRSTSCSALQWTPQTAMRADQVGLVRRVRHRAAGHRHAADHAHRDAGGRADRSVRGDLHGGICHAAIPRWSSRCSKSSPAFRPWCSASSRR